MRPGSLTWGETRTPELASINTTSKPGLPSNNLLRNQHGQTRRERHNKKRKQHTRDETDTTTMENRSLGFGQLGRLWRIFVGGQFGPCANRLSPGAARTPTDLELSFRELGVVSSPCDSMHITTFFKGRRWQIVNHSRNSQTVSLTLRTGKPWWTIIGVLCDTLISRL